MERLAPPLIPAGPGRSAEWLEIWKGLVGRGDPARFALRLELLGWDEITACQALGAVTLSEDWEPPSWVLVLADALERSATLGQLDFAELARDRALSADKPRPFEHLHLPFIKAARARVARTIAELELSVAETALASAEQGLLEELARLCANVLYAEFGAFRSLNGGFFSRFEAAATDDPARDEYEHFVQHFLSEEAAPFYAAYPLLARLLGTLVDDWVNGLCEFAQRLERDLPLLALEFPEFPQASAVRALTTALSDRHFEGRTVLRVELDNGLVLAYKPKDLSLEKAFFEWIEWCNSSGSPVPLARLRTLCREGYGYTEWAEASACEGAEAVARYFERAGALTCLIHALGGTDCHYENIVAKGEFPLLVDAESLLHHRRPGPSDTDVDRAASYQAESVILDSVLGTMMLPRWVAFADGSTYDASGLGTTPGEPMPFTITEWQHVNSNAMQRTTRPARAPGRKLGPCVAGKTASPADFADAIVAGFSRMYRFLVEQRGPLLGDDGPFERFRGLTSRFLLRPTLAYAVLTDWLRHPTGLRDGARAWIQVDLLANDLLDAPNAAFRPVLPDEQASTLRLDTPFLSAPVDTSDVLLANGVRVVGCLAAPSLEAARQRILRMTESDLSLQNYLIQGSLIAYARRGLRGDESRHEVAQAASPPSAVASAPSGGAAGDLGDPRGNAMPERSFLQIARSIGERLQRQAVHGARGQASWIALLYRPQLNRFQLEPAGVSFYEGTTGIGFFLSALFHATAEPALRELALAALLELFDVIATRSPEALATRAGQPSPAGLGNLIYGLSCVGSFLQERRPHEAALELAERLTRAHAEADAEFDVLFGSAGMVLGLLRLHAATGADWVLDRAAAFADRLVLTCQDTPRGGAAWVAPAYGRPLTGFSHGAAGMAYALLRLFEKRPDPAYLRTAEAAYAYERAVFSASVGNWPDLRYPEEAQKRGMSWCHGAPGIGLGRLGALASVADAAVEREIRAALDVSLALPMRDIDHLCCGNLGIVELALTAGIRRGEPPLVDAARARARALVARAERRGHFALAVTDSAYADGCFPGLFQGESGVGYELLRLSDPKTFPSLLLFE